MCDFDFLYPRKMRSYFFGVNVTIGMKSIQRVVSVVVLSVMDKISWGEGWMISYSNNRRYYAYQSNPVRT